MRIKFTVNPVFNRRKVKEGKATVELQIYQNSPVIRKYISTGIAIDVQHWNADKNQVSDKHPNAVHLNKILRECINTIEDFAYAMRANKQPITKEALERFMNSSKTSNNSFTEFFKEEIDPTLKRGTRKEHQYTLNLLNEFRPKINFSDINLAFIQDFDRFLKYEKKLKPNTIYKHHQHVNRFLKLAELNGYYKETTPYANFKTKKEKSDRMSLSMDELKAIEELDTTAYPEIVAVKDMFIFSCYTGLRFSDIISLESKHLINTKEGLTIVKKMEKVPKPITLPLALLFNGKPLEIISKYKSDPVFPTLTNQHVNRLLKVIATIAKTPMRLTFHIARHTFGTMLADTTQNPYLIMDLMGHADMTH